MPQYLPERDASGTALREPFDELGQMTERMRRSGRFEHHVPRAPGE